MQQSFIPLQQAKDKRMTDVNTVTVREASTPDQTPLRSIMISPDYDCGWFATWDMERDIDGVGPTDPLVEYIKDRLDLPDPDEVRDGYVYDETRFEEKPLKQWRKDPHSNSPDIGLSCASITDQIDVVWRADSNEWIVDILDEEDIVVNC